LNDTARGCRAAKEALKRIYRGSKRIKEDQRASTEALRGISSVFNMARKIEYRGSMWPEKLNTANQCGQRN
jgi:hypothetical protein